MPTLSTLRIMGKLEWIISYRIFELPYKLKPEVYVVDLLRDDKIPWNEEPEWIFAQNATAVPSGPQVLGRVMEAWDKLPRSTHCFSDRSIYTALFT